MLPRAAVSTEQWTRRGSVSKFIHVVVGGSQCLGDYWTEQLSFSWPRTPSISQHVDFSLDCLRTWLLAPSSVRDLRSHPRSRSFYNLIS